MEIGFFFWPYTPELVRQMGDAAERYGYDMVGIADTPGNAMDPWVAATILAQAVAHPRIAQCVTNLSSRHPAVSAAAIASLDLLAPGRTILGVGSGHSGTRNLGISGGNTAALAEGIDMLRALLAGRAARWQGGEAHLPWIRRPSPVFLSASGPKALAVAGSVADGVFVNFGLTREAIARSEPAIAAAAKAAGRDPDAVEIWQIAALDCNRDRSASRRKIGAILAFMAAGYVLQGDLSARGVPEHLHAQIAALRQRYSTRPGEADAVLVDRLGLFDYLAGRFAVYGTPEECGQQMLAAKAAGLRRVMFSVSLAADPVATVELFGAEVMPGLR